jgi:hypothetical protein
VFAAKGDVRSLVLFEEVEPQGVADHFRPSRRHIGSSRRLTCTVRSARSGTRGIAGGLAYPATDSESVDPGKQDLGIPTGPAKGGRRGRVWFPRVEVGRHRGA